MPTKSKRLTKKKKPFTKRVAVHFYVDVTVDESKFDETFMREFRESFYKFYTLEEHLQYLAQLYVRGIIDGFSNPFIEGYGLASDMGIKFDNLDQEEEITD